MPTHFRFEEAQNDVKTDIVVESKNLSYLIDEITKMLQHNHQNAGQIRDVNIKSRYERTNAEISGASNRLQQLLRSQKGATVDRAFYGPLHDELRTILQNLVLEVQITDFVNCSVILELCKRNLDCIIRMRRISSDTTTYTPQAALNALVLVSREQAKLALDLQINTRTRLAEITDIDLRNRLTNASEVFRVSTPVAIQSCQQFIEANTSQDNRDKSLLAITEALQEIVTVIQLSSAFVSSFNMSFPFPELKARKEEVNDNSFMSDYKRAPRVNAELNRLEDAIRRGDDKAAIEAVKGFAEEATKQVALGRAHAAEKRDPLAKAELLKYCADLERLTPQVVQAAKDSLSNKGNAKLQENLFGKISEARIINNKIEDALKPEKSIIAMNKALDGSLKQLADFAMRGDTVNAIDMAKKVADQMKKQIEMARSYAETVKDPERKRAILEAADELERLLTQIALATKAVLENPNDKEAQKRLLELTEKARLAGAKLAASIIEDQLALNREALQASLGDLYKACTLGDAKRAAEILKDITDQIQRRIELGRELASQVKDPILKKQILDACDALERLLPEVVMAAKEVLRDPTNESAKQRLRDLIEDVKSASDRITATKKYSDALSTSQVKLNRLSSSSNLNNVDTTAEEIIVNGGNLDSELTRLKNAANNKNAKEATSAATEVGKQIRQQAELARKLANQVSDPQKKKQLLDSASNLDKLSKPIADTTTSLVKSNFNDKVAHQKLNELIDQARSNNNNIVAVADTVRSTDKKLQDITSKMSKSMGMTDTPEKSEFRADGSKDEIMVAAHKVSAAVKQTQNVTPEQSNLMKIAKDISAQMELLSLAAQSKNKKDMIAAARKISELIAQVQALSSDIASRCTDPILREQLLSISKVPKNFGTQLKIVAAVKAASDDDDETAENQLITCNNT